MSKSIEDPPSLVDVLVREHAARAARIAAEADHVLATDTHVDVHTDTEIALASEIVAGAIVAPQARASSPRILVEELTRECAKRRAALDDEARRG